MVEKYYPAFFILLTVAVCAFSYKAVLDYHYVWDDMMVRQAQNYFTLPSPWKEAFAKSYLNINYYRPLPVLTMIYETRMIGGASASEANGHLINYSLFLLLMMAVWCTTFKLLASNRVIFRSVTAALVTLFVGLHPAVVIEPAWVSARFDLSMTFFAVLLLYFDMTIADTVKRAVVTGVLFLMAALCKESAFALLLFLPLWHMCNKSGVPDTNISWFKFIKLRGYDKSYVALALAAIFYLYIRYLGLGYLFLDDNSVPDRGTLIQSTLLVGKTFLIYARLLFWPFGAIAPAYPQPLPILITDSSAWFGLVFLLGIFFAGLCLALGKKNIIGWILLAWISLLLPILNLKQVPLPDSIAELRYLGMPFVLMVLVLISVIGACWKNFSHTSLLALLIGCLVWSSVAAASFQSTLSVWRNDLIFWQWYLQEVPTSPIAHMNYSRALRMAGRFEESIVEAKISIREHPEQTAVASWINVILSQMQLRQYEEAKISIAAYLKIAYAPDPVALGHLLMANILMSQSQLDKAGEELQQALKLNPQNIQIRVQKIRWLFLRGEKWQAEEEAYAALELLGGNYAQLAQLLKEIEPVPGDELLRAAIRIQNGKRMD